MDHQHPICSRHCGYNYAAVMTWLTTKEDEMLVKTMDDAREASREDEARVSVFSILCSFALFPLSLYL